MPSDPSVAGKKPHGIDFAPLLPGMETGQQLQEIQMCMRDIHCSVLRLESKLDASSRNFGTSMNNLDQQLVNHTDHRITTELNDMLDRFTQNGTPTPPKTAERIKGKSQTNQADVLPSVIHHLSRLEHRLNQTNVVEHLQRLEQLLSQVLGLHLLSFPDKNLAPVGDPATMGNIVRDASQMFKAMLQAPSPEPAAYATVIQPKTTASPKAERLPSINLEQQFEQRLAAVKMSSSSTATPDFQNLYLASLTSGSKLSTEAAARIRKLSEPPTQMPPFRTNIASELVNSFDPRPEVTALPSSRPDDGLFHVASSMMPASSMTPSWSVMPSSSMTPSLSMGQARTATGASAVVGAVAQIDRETPWGMSPSVDTHASQVSQVSQSRRLQRGFSRITAGFSVNEGGTTPQRAFVINVRRLVLLEERVKLIHIFIESTAVAALTLVAADTWHQIDCTLMFLITSLGLFTLHHESWDSFDTDDLLELIPLLSDDRDGEDASMVNPNRLLKAISVTHYGWLKIVERIILFCLCLILAFSWMVMARWWGLREDGRILEGVLPPNFEFQEDRYFYQKWSDAFITHFFTQEGDSETMGVQVTVATLLVILHIYFELVMHNYFGAVMPHVVSREGGSKTTSVWDPRIHGMPWRYYFTGMPCVWFTSHEALADVKNFIARARNMPVKYIYPQEIAFLVLSGPDGRAEVQHSLMSSKLYNAKDNCFVKDPSVRQELGIELLLFDSHHHSPGMKYPGEFARCDDYDQSEVVDEALRALNNAWLSAPRALGTRSGSMSGSISA